MLEAAVSRAFSNFLNKKRAIKELDYIVVNKCHVLIELTEK